MIAALLNIIFIILVVILDKIMGLWRWYKDKFKNIKENPWNILKITLATLAVCYGFSRVQAIAEIIEYKGSITPYTAEELEYINPNKIERYQKLYAKTKYLDRYFNLQARFERNEKYGLYLLTTALTYPRHQKIRFHKHIHRLYYINLYLEDINKFNEELEFIKWMSKKDKADFTKIIGQLSKEESFISQLNKNNN